MNRRSLSPSQPSTSKRVRRLGRAAQPIVSVADSTTPFDVEPDIEPVFEEPLAVDDNFVIQLDSELQPCQIDRMTECRLDINHVQWPTLGKVSVYNILEEPSSEVEYPALLGQGTMKLAAPRGIPQVDQLNIEDLHIKPKILKNISSSNMRFNDMEELNDFQTELLALLTSYKDLYYPEQTLDNLEQIRMVYSIHALNHVLKTRQMVEANNRRRAPDTRDLGLVRPKVLVLVPFRDSALRFVNMIIALLGCSDVHNKQRFLQEFSGQTVAMPFKNPKPRDYERIFSGNTHDNFRIGVSIATRSIKLYSDFYKSDIIISSPLALKILIAGELDEQDYDFLASVEVMIVDQAEILLMQNWDHLLEVINHLHMSPQQQHGTDLMRVRMWSLNGMSKFYLQMLIFASHQMPEINALSTSRSNYAGRIVVFNPIVNGSITTVVLNVPQVFHRIEAASLVEAQGKRLRELIENYIAQYRTSLAKHVLIFIPSYFDFVQIRNYFKRSDLSFVQICEYSEDNKVARARDKFFHGEVQFLLYTERVHFFKRLRIRGIKHLIFFQLPSIPSFYSELVNLIESTTALEEEVANCTVTSLYTKYDAIQLTNIVGSEKAARMLAAEQNIHLYTTEC